MSKVFGNRPHKGIRTFSGSEATNVILGQAGFDIIQGASVNGTEAIAGEGDYADVRMWVAIKAVEGVDAELQCETAQGDDFSKTGAYSSAGSTNNMTLKDQDMINGCFTTIRVTGASVYVLAYRG
jgi:hypothetical protein